MAKNQIVTTDYPPSIWAEKILYLDDTETAEGVLIYGIRGHRAAGRDPLQLHAKKITKKREPSGPLIEFANAKGPARRRFLERYGPFVASSDADGPNKLTCVHGPEDARQLQTKEQRLSEQRSVQEAINRAQREGIKQIHLASDFANYDISVLAHQDFRDFDAERNLFANVMQLMTRADRSAQPEDVSLLLTKLAAGTRTWVRQYTRECERRAAIGRARPAWRWTMEEQRSVELWAEDVARIVSGNFPVNQGTLGDLDTLEGFWGGPLVDNRIRTDHFEIAHCVISTVLNAFPTAIRFHHNGIDFVRTDTLPADDRVFGCRPAFYALLRLEYLSPKNRFTMCKDCSEWFSGDGLLCSECGRKHSQNRYWQRKGKFTRRKRLQKQKRARAFRS